MNKSYKKFKQKIATLILTGAIVFTSIGSIFADGSRVVTLGANLSSDQRATILKYFGVNENEVEILEVNNQEERQYLEGVASEAQIGKKTYSCAYIEPTKPGSGINVKTANITWVTPSMIASTMSSLQILDANVIIAANFPVSGTGALTGIIKAYETTTGETIDEEKKEIATEELIITGDLGEDIGQDKATGVINDIKTEVIKNNTQDNIQIAETITNITNNYNITLTPEQQKSIENLMSKIADQDYNYNEMKDALDSVKDTVNDRLDEMGESIQTGILDTIKDWFKDLGDWFSGLFSEVDKDLGILGNTNDNILGENAQIDATDKEAIQLPSSEEVQGFFSKLWNWFTDLFDNEENTNAPEINEMPKDESTSEPSNDNLKSPDSNTEDTAQPEEQPTLETNDSETDHNQSENSSDEIPQAQ